MASEFEVQRQGWRIKCGDHCVIRYDRRDTECVLVDISVTGVLVSCSEDQAERLQPGDRCGLFLCSDPGACSIEVTCTVVRREAGRVGLQFLTGA